MNTCFLCFSMEEFIQVLLTIKSKSEMPFLKFLLVYMHVNVLPNKLFILMFVYDTVY